MATKNVFDVDAWAKDLREKYNLPEADVSHAVGEIKRGFKRQDDFNRDEDKLREKEREIAEFEAKQQEWWNTNRPILERAYDLTQKYGSLDDLEDRLTRITQEEDMGKLTEEEAQELINRVTNEVTTRVEQKVAGQANSVIELNRFFLTKVQSHRDEFSEPLDIPALEKYAAEQAATGRRYQNYDAIYDDWVKDKRKSKEEADREAWKAEERKNIEREVMSRTGVPYVPQGPSSLQSPLYATKEDTSADARESFVRAYQQTE